MKISTKFNLNQDIYIKRIKMDGRIKGIFVSENGTEYRIRYFPENKSTLEYFDEDEIQTEIPENKPLFEVNE